MQQYALLVLLVLSQGSCVAQALSELTDFGPDPGNLRTYVHVPASAGANSAPLPLVVALHGCGQSAAELIEISGWDKLADLRGFVLLCPEQRGANNISHCFNWFRQRDAHGSKGESASIRNMINEVKARWSIDSGRVFIYGVSAGAAMAVDLMAENPRLFKAGASIAGGPFLGDVSVLKAMRTMINPKDRTPAEWRNVVLQTFPGVTGPWPDLIVMHGTSDHVVDPRASDELIDQWAGLHDLIPEKGAHSERVRAGIERTTYHDVSGHAAIVGYRIADLGHALAIDPGEGPCQGGTIGKRSIDLDFHSTCVIADHFGL